MRSEFEPGIPDPCGTGDGPGWGECDPVSMIDRCQIVGFGMDVLRELEAEFSHKPLFAAGFTFAGGVNLELVAWLVNWLKTADELPEDTIVSWCWPDPGRRSLALKVHSRRLPEVPPGNMPPERWLEVEALQEDEHTRTLTPHLVDPFAPRTA